MSDEMREKLAEYAYEAWSVWMKHLLSKCRSSEGLYVIAGKPDAVIPGWSVECRMCQMKTAYADLTEKEKKSCREQADRMLRIVAPYIEELRAEIEELQSDRKAKVPIITGLSVTQAKEIERLQLDNRGLFRLISQIEGVPISVQREIARIKMKATKLGDR